MHMLQQQPHTDLSQAPNSSSHQGTTADKVTGPVCQDVVCSNAWACIHGVHIIGAGHVMSLKLGPERLVLSFTYPQVLNLKISVVFTAQQTLCFLSEAVLWVNHAWMWYDMIHLFVWFRQEMADVGHRK